MIRRIGTTLLTSLVALGAVSCGGYSSNNDQGTSFLAYGWFADTQGTTGETGQTVVLGQDAPVANLAATGGIVGDGNIVFTHIGLQNRLSSQFIRVVRVDCSYDIPGASSLLQIPNDSFNSSNVIAAAGDDANNPGGPQAGEGSTVVMGFDIVSTDIMSYINVNRNLLPELPFRLNVTCSAVGVTQAGDTLTTNELVYPILFVDSAECCTGVNDNNLGGFTGGTGNGGGITFDDGTDSTTINGGTTGGATSGEATTTGTETTTGAGA
ncbi:MAG: hypothetical protein U0136_09425 [Bdellovibrionota bacterium]